MYKYPLLFRREPGKENLWDEYNVDPEGLETKAILDGKKCTIINGEPYYWHSYRVWVDKEVTSEPYWKARDVYSHWSKVSNPYVLEGYANRYGEGPVYVCLGPSIWGNKHGLDSHIWVSDDIWLEPEELSFNYLKEYLRTLRYDGLLFYRDGEPVAKLSKYNFNYPRVGYKNPIEDLPSD